MVAGEVGTPRWLRLVERWRIKTGWFAPGHSIDAVFAPIEVVADAGHAVGTHGDRHANPAPRTPEQDEAIV